MDWVSISVVMIFMSVVLWLTFQTIITAFFQKKEAALKKMELTARLQEQRIEELELENQQLDLKIQIMNGGKELRSW